MTKTCPLLVLMLAVGVGAQAQTPGPLESALVFIDGPHPSPYVSALATLSVPHQVLTDPAGFSLAVASADPAKVLVIVDSYWQPQDLNCLLPFVNGGGRAILQYWKLASGNAVATAFGAGACFQITSAGPVHDWGGSPFFEGIDTPLAVNDLFISDGVRMQTSAGAKAVAGFTSASAANQAAIIVANSNRTILNGFLMEEVASGSLAVQVARNEIQFLAQSAGPPTITADPENCTVVEGALARLTVAASADPAPVYQWLFQGNTLVPGATNATLVLRSVTLEQTGSYQAVVSNVHGAATSNPAWLTVLPSAPVQHALLLVDGAHSSVFETVLLERGLPYQRYSEVSGFNDALRQSDLASTLAIADVSYSYVDLMGLARFATAGGRSILEYWNLASGPVASAFEVSVAQTVNGSPPVFDWGCPELFTGVTNPVALMDNLSSSGVMLEPLPGGEALAGFTATPAPNQAAVVRGNNARSLVNGFLGENVVSLAQAVELAANEIRMLCTDPLILAHPLDQWFCGGEAVVLSVSASGSPPLLYQWRKEGTNIDGAVSSTYALTSAMACDAGDYDVVVTSSAGSVTSVVATLRLSLVAADAFNPGASDAIEAIAVQPDGKILVGGSFGRIAGVNRAFIVRLSPDGTLDPDFNAVVNERIRCIAVQEDGGILIGGAFSSVNGLVRLHLARLHPDGTPDTSFLVSVDNIVSFLSVDHGGSFLVAGSFSQVNGAARCGLARITRSGALDHTFVPDLAGAFLCAYRRTDGSILVGGTAGLQRVLADGSRDQSFNLPLDHLVLCLAEQADGGMLIGGTFTTVDGQSRSYLARLDQDFSLDHSFNPALDGAVESIYLQTDGSIVLSGLFSSLGGMNVRYFGRLNRDGSADAAFRAGVDQPGVAVAIQPDGRLILGGRFSRLAGQDRSCLGRLRESRTPTQAIVSTPLGLEWRRGGNGPEFCRTTFEVSRDGSNWVSGPGQRITGGWAMPLSLSSGCAVRLRGWTPSGVAGGSESLVEAHVPAIINVDRAGFQIIGSPGRWVVVETSEDFEWWTPIATNRMEIGPIYFGDPAWGRHFSRMYRLCSP